MVQSTILKKKTDAELAALFKPTLIEKGYNLDESFIQEYCRLVKEKAQFVHEFWQHGYFILEAPTSYDEKVMTKKWNADVKALFVKLADKFNTISKWEAHELHEVFNAATAELGKLDMQVMRVLVTGVAGGPQLFDVMALIGKEKTLERLNNAFAKLS